MAGYVYIMSNPAFPDRIKIGKSDRDPDDFRKHELNSTGVPEAFKVEYWAYVDNHHEIEKQLHRRFQSSRPNKNREFFTCSIPAAIDAIRELEGPTLKEKVKYKSPEELYKLKLQREKRDKEEKTERERLERKRINDIKKQRMDGIRSELTDLLNKKYNKYLSDDVSGNWGWLSLGAGLVGFFLFGTKITGANHPFVAFGSVIAGSALWLISYMQNKGNNPEKDKLLKNAFQKYHPEIEKKIQSIEKGISNDPNWEKSLDDYRRRALATLGEALDQEGAKLLRRY